MRKLLALLVALIALGSAALAVPALSATRTVRVVDNAFEPGSLTARRGDTIRFRWRGEQSHNVVGRGPTRFRSPIRDEGTYAVRVRRTGRYRIVCELHPGMGMTLRVRR